MLFSYKVLVNEKKINKNLSQTESLVINATEQENLVNQPLVKKNCWLFIDPENPCVFWSILYLKMSTEYASM